VKRVLAWLAPRPTSPDGGAAEVHSGPPSAQHPESRRRHDVYVNKRFIAIFEEEDRDGALARYLTAKLAANDEEGGK